MTSEVKPRKQKNAFMQGLLGDWGWRLWFAEIGIGVLVLMVWHPLAAFVGITQPWVTILFVVAWMIFWNVRAGWNLRAALIQRIYGYRG